MFGKSMAGIALSALLLSGCTMTEAMLASASIATFVQTDKTMTDHVVSYVSGDDCSILHTQDGGEYCRDTTEGPKDASVAQQTYCYRTLGGIDCYMQEDPKASSSQVIN